MSDETKPPDEPPPPPEPPEEPDTPREPQSPRGPERSQEPTGEKSPRWEAEPPEREPEPTPLPPLSEWASRERVIGPAVGLMVVAAVGAVLELSAVPLNLIGVTLGPWTDPAAWWADFLGGLAWLLWVLVGLVLAAVVFYAGYQMKNLRNWTLAAVASVLVMVPCVSPCCLLGIPVGVWGLIVLSDPRVRGSFR